MDKLLEVEDGSDKKQKSSVLVQKFTPKISKEEHYTLADKIFNLGCKTSYFSIDRKYQENYKPKLINDQFQKVLTELYDEKLVDLQYQELLTHCKSIDVGFTTQQADKFESQTKNQAQSKLWHRFRAGRITASNFKAGCHTDPAMPSASLISKICYPSEHKFENDAMKWGNLNEETARKTYHSSMMKTHKNFKIVSSGLCLNVKYPYLGASPDGFVSCDCCGNGAIELKCPFSMKDKALNEGDNKF